MKCGTVALIGRPNVGKSTLVNSLIGQKVAITSPKAQTTRFAIHALYQDERGQIIFVDTPGIFNKTKDALSKKINQKSSEAFSTDTDVIIYLIDHTRHRDFEEAKVLGMVRKINKPKILVFNKDDITEPTYLPQYKFLEDEFKDIFYVSALENKGLKPLLNKIFEYLPETKEKMIEDNEYVHPALNMDSKMFLAEIIREKVFLKTRKEIPYTTTVIIDEITEKKGNVTYIKARILTSDEKYRPILIGQGARRIKEIGTMARKELETATKRKIFLDLHVEVDKHWVQTLA
jgi:GTP-binding protein Era